jgi:hypothetical protein
MLKIVFDTIRRSLDGVLGDPRLASAAECPPEGLGRDDGICQVAPRRTKMPRGRSSFVRKQKAMLAEEVVATKHSKKKKKKKRHPGSRTSLSCRRAPF